MVASIGFDVGAHDTEENCEGAGAINSRRFFNLWIPCTKVILGEDQEERIDGEGQDDSQQVIAQAQLTDENELRNQPAVKE